MRHRFTRLLVVATVLLLALPAGASAAPAVGTCAAEVNVAQVAAVPADFRTPGVHRFERWYFVTLADGTVEDWGVVGNSIEIAEDAAPYRDVMLRVVSNWGIGADGSIARIERMRPDQPARFYSQFSWLRSDPIASVRVLLRYETRKNRWTDWTELAASAETSLCNQATQGVVKKSFGWAS